MYSPCRLILQMVSIFIFSSSMPITRTGIELGRHLGLSECLKACRIVLSESQQFLDIHAQFSKNIVGPFFLNPGEQILALDLFELRAKSHDMSRFRLIVSTRTMQIIICPRRPEHFPAEGLTKAMHAALFIGEGFGGKRRV